MDNGDNQPRSHVDERVAAILREFPPCQNFEELLGPEPENNDSSDVDEFLSELRRMKQGPASSINEVQ